MSEKREIEVTCGRCGGCGTMSKKVITRVECSSCSGKGYVVVKKAKFPNTTKTETKKDKPPSQEGE